MFIRSANTLKYIFLISIFCIYMTACGNADRQSAVEQSGAEIVETENTETKSEETTDTAYAETESEAANVIENIQDMPEINIVNVSIVEVKIKNKEEYEGFVSRLGEFVHYNMLRVDLEETDTTIYLDEILDCQNFELVQIRNGGRISVKDMQDFTYPMVEIALYHIFAVEEDVVKCLVSSDTYSLKVLAIELDNRYSGKLPIEELLNFQDCTDVILIWDDDTEGAGLLDMQENMENLRDWDYLQSVQEADVGCLKGIYRLNDGDYSYTSYEFYDHYEEDGTEIQAAFICMKDRESNGDKYFDIIDVPVDRFSNDDSLWRITSQRLDVSDDLNLDGYKDLVFKSRYGDLHRIEFLWNEKEHRFILDTRVQDFFESADAARNMNMDIKDESYIDAERVISDFLSMDSVEFQEKYNRDDLYYSGILYCGLDAWKYNGSMLSAFQEKYYDVENVTAIRFYKKQPVPVYLDMNINDQIGQCEEEISVDYHTDYAVSVYSKLADDNLSYTQEISFVKIELSSGAAPEDLYDYIETGYYKVMEELNGETWILSPDGEKAACVSNGMIPMHPSKIFIWYKEDHPYTVFREYGAQGIAGWIDDNHLVCYHHDYYPVLMHLERNETEEVPRENCDYDAYGVKYYIQGDNLIAQPYIEEPYQWQIQEKDGEIYIVEPD